MNEYGELLDANTMQFVRLLPGPIERVWRYLTESDKRARWLCAGDVETTVDGHVDMHFHNVSLSGDDDIPRPDRDTPEKVSFRGKVMRCEPPHMLEHTWEFGDEFSIVRYELEERAGKVRLVLTHRRLETSDVLLSVSSGWHSHLNLLEDVLEGRRRRPIYRMQVQYEEEYGQRLGLQQA
jgi:uncharacterized protein YndB with AHSA1/START domain